VKTSGGGIGWLGVIFAKAAETRVAVGWSLERVDQPKSVVFQ
jgi:hypothetical protein